MKSILLIKTFWGLAEMTFGQAVKMTFFAPCKISLCMCVCMYANGSALDENF